MKLALLALATVALKGCPAPMAATDSCEVLKATLFHTGKFALSDAEIAGLTQEHQVAVGSVKIYFRDHCPH